MNQTKLTKNGISGAFLATVAVLACLFLSSCVTMKKAERTADKRAAEALADGRSQGKTEAELKCSSQLSEAYDTKLEAEKAAFAEGRAVGAIATMQKAIFDMKRAHGNSARTIHKFIEGRITAWQEELDKFK